MATIATLLDNIAAYDAARDQLETEHLGQWVLFYNAEMIGAFDDFQVVANEAVSRFGKGPYLIREVGVPNMRSMPASVQYRRVT